MVHNFNVENLFNGGFNCFNSRVTKFQYFTGLGHDNVVVLFVLVRLFKLRRIFAKLVLPYQATRHKQIDGIVKSGATYTVVFVLHLDVE